MRALVVDDEPIVLDDLVRQLSGCSRIDYVAAFGSSRNALVWLEDNRVDVAFLDVRMPEIDGIALAQSIKEYCPLCAIVFVTAHEDYALEAIQMHVSGYLMKPAMTEDIDRELDYIEQAGRTSGIKRPGLWVQCFGTFEVFHEGLPLRFKHAKTKELFAYLIDRRGVFCDIATLCAVLWENKPGNAATKSHLRHLVSDLSTRLAEVGHDGALLKRRGALAIVPDELSCDYYAWLAGASDMITARSGEYMLQYSWAENTTGTLMGKREH